MDKKKPTTTSNATGGHKSKHMSNPFNGVTATSSEQPDNAPRQRRILQNFRLIWLDANIDETNEDFCNSITHLRGIVNTTDTFTDPDRCVGFLSEIKDEKAFMLVSGALGQRMVPLLHDMSQLTSIYVFCGNKSRHEQWAKDWSKVKGVFTKIDPICDALKLAARQCDQDSIDISLLPAVQASIQNPDQLDQSFMYTQLLKEILLEIEDYDDQSIKDFTAYCRDRYGDNHVELKKIAKFEREYRRKSPIWWYTYDCFLYSMLNRALRTQEMDSLITMGFFIRDLHQQIQQLHTEQFDSQQIPPFTVYRGQGLLQKDFENMQKAKGGLLSFNNFLSTSKKSDVSREFAERALETSENVGILFKMTINSAVSSAPFAYVGQVGFYKNEEEILFSMHTVFRIRDIKRIGNNNRLWQVELTLTADSDQQLNALTQRMREETFEGAEGWYRLGSLLIKAGQSERAEQVYRTLLDKASNDSEKASIYNQLGRIKDDQGDYKEAIFYYEKDLEISQNTLPPNHPDLAVSYNNIGVAFKNMGEDAKALSSHERALEIKQKSLPPNHPDLAASYNNIGSTYYSTRDYSKALSYYEKALEIKQKALPPNHPDLATFYNNIGNVYSAMSERPEAVSFYEKALEIRRKSLPPNHPNLGASYNNIGDEYYQMGDYSKALSFCELAVEIGKCSLPSNHPHLQQWQNNLENIEKKNCK